MIRCYEKNLTVDSCSDSNSRIICVLRLNNWWYCLDNVMCDQDEENENCTPQTFTEAAKITTLNLLPAKSRKKYDMAYKAFLKKRHVRSRKTFSWYTSPSRQRNPSPPRYGLCSILKSTIRIHHDIHVETYH